MSIGELSVGEMSVRGIARSGNCPLENCPSGNCPSGKCLRGTVRRGKVLRRNVRRGAVLEPRCMVYRNAFYICVVAPIAAILMGNIIILVMVTIRLHRNRKHKPTSIITRVITKARVAFACNLFFGTTWVLAFFAVEEVTMVFQWLFCITNSLQGFFIFVFYTMRNKEVRNIWLKALGKDLLSNS